MDFHSYNKLKEVKEHNSKLQIRVRVLENQLKLNKLKYDRRNFRVLMTTMRAIMRDRVDIQSIADKHKVDYATVMSLYNQLTN